MNARFLGILTALVVVVAAAAVWLSISRQDTAEAETLYPALKQNLDAIAAVRIYGAGNERKVELVREQNEWRVSERAHYPAAPDTVRQLLLDLSEAQRVEEKTSNPANYGALGVQDVQSPDASGVRVELIGTSKPVDVILGKAGLSTNSRYIRKVNDKTSWLADRALDAPSDPKQWLKNDLIDIAVERIHSAHIEIAGAQPYTATKANRNEPNFAVSGLKKGQSLHTDSAANGVGTALASLNLEDVAPHAEWENTQPAARATYKTFDGITLELSGWTEGNVHRLHIRARYDDALAQQFASDPASGDKSKEKSPDRRTEAAALDARLQPWVFQLAEYKYGAVFPPLDELLKKQ